MPLQLRLAYAHETVLSRLAYAYGCLWTLYLLILYICIISMLFIFYIRSLGGREEERERELVVCDRKVCAVLREGHQGLMKGGKKKGLKSV